MAQTVVIWDAVESEPICYFVVDRDIRYLDREYFRGDDAPGSLGKEVSNLMYNNAGKKAIETLSEFPVEAVRAGAHVIVCGTLP